MHAVCVFFKVAFEPPLLHELKFSRRLLRRVGLGSLFGSSKADKVALSDTGALHNKKKREEQEERKRREAVQPRPPQASARGRGVCMWPTRCGDLVSTHGGRGSCARIFVIVFAVRGASHLPSRMSVHVDLCA